jgi:GNAT superfamily N-acetyltransferase
VKLPPPTGTRVTPGTDAPLASAHSVSVLRWEDEYEAAGVLARAFIDDPLVTAICPGPAHERQRRMWWSFRVAVRSHYLSRQPAWSIVGPDAMPVAVVLVNRSHPAVQPRLDVVFALRGFAHLGVSASLRGLRAAQTIAAHAPPQPFTYLRTLGVDPRWQGRGLGSQLVEWVVRAAPAGLPVYLETAKEGNLSFYARHGFTCVGDFRCLGVPVWRLVRPGRTTAGNG